MTTDILLADLISGRAISTNEGHSLAVATDHARSVLNWYRSNRKWAGNVMATDCEAIIDAIANVAPTLATPVSASSRAVQHLKLVKLVAHRFAGLHAYGTATSAPDDFVFEPVKPITMFEGWNGSGKTSLVNAIIWCLTGQLLRPQRLPEGGDRDFDCIIDRDVDPTKHIISPVTPLPHANDWTPDASAKSIPADTWVELTFADVGGNLLPPVRRTQTRKTNGKLVEEGPDIATLGVDPIAFRLGTSMPGILPFLQIGSSSELGVAIAKLTGLADLVDLARHAGKASKKIAGDITKERKNELDRIDDGFAEHRRDLEARIEEFPAMRPADALPNAADESAAEVVIRLQIHFEKLKAEGLADAREVLGDSFDPEVASQRKDLEENIGPAIEQLRMVRTLPSIERIGKLVLDAEAIAKARDLLKTLRTEASMLSELADNPTLARRTQLYARVATWMAEQGETQEDHCAVCRHSLAGVIDPDTNMAVAEHIRQVRDDGELVAQTIAQWERRWSGTLSRDLPEALRAEMERDLPKHPGALLDTGLKEELFATDGFRGTLRALQPLAKELVEAATAALPPFEEPESEALPENMVAEVGKLPIMIARIERALAFAEWMAANPGALRSALEKVRNGGGTAAGEVVVGMQEHAASIGGSLSRLDEIVKGVAPISAAITLTDRLDASLKSRQTKLARIEACGQCAKALDEIVPIGALAQEQVEGLRRQLHDRAEYWRDQIYQNATSFAPKPLASGMSAQGVIDIQVGRGIVRAPAQHVSNSSALRAGLMAFYLAFREYVLKTSGGLTILVLDDPQDLLDYDNRQRLARAFTQLASDGAQIVTTTHDRSFARTLVQESRPADLIAHRSVHPVNISRATLETSLAVDELDRKRQLFIANPDVASYAQDYANEARIFIEARLGDLFDDPAYPAHSAPTKAPTLVPLFDRLKALVSGRSNELFRSPVLNDFCNDQAMTAGADTRRILNTSHHDKASISYADVERVDGDLKRLRAGVERVHGEFRRYRWREPLTEALPTNVVTLIPVKVPAFSIPVRQDIAAFTGHLPLGESQVAECEIFSSSWFDDKALFYIRHDTMGFAMPAGSVAIVEAEPSPARDHSLVVARRGKQAYARRLLRPRNGEGFSLAAEATDPRKSRPTLAFEDHGIDVHRVVGLLLSHLPPPHGREEAIEIESDPILAKVEVAYRVREESAVPLALPGQTILGGKVLTAGELSALEGQVVALTLDDGTSILKRVGSQVTSAFPYLRQFETIGGLGESVVIATESIEGAPNMPIMAYARPIIGVIYDH
ncbi:MAG TPA: AAA family ATPase [Pelagibacterium sp.]|uniref:AAA family ATPase n=1 Tax=Pelagibacterium sp. TaxID=1967288 RepID=UPI002CBAAFE8|nr:AAA family ATPase [Pelagibacterium sp.]HWJ87804.1 AAA family ATPase [Pelagibacterium sp.]